jgi:hypothetical protein
MSLDNREGKKGGCSRHVYEYNILLANQGITGGNKYM